MFCYEELVKRLSKKTELYTVAEIPEESVINVMEAKINELVKNTEKMMKNILKESSDQEFALIFDCVSRQDLLEENGQGKKEINIILKNFREKLPIMGVLSYGEIGSFNDTPTLHNKTLSLGIGCDRK